MCVVWCSAVLCLSGRSEVCEFKERVVYIDLLFRDQCAFLMISLYEHRLMC